MPYVGAGEGEVELLVVEPLEAVHQPRGRPRRAHKRQRLVQAVGRLGRLPATQTGEARADSEASQRQAYAY
jgi:hypothetical protein